MPWCPCDIISMASEITIQWLFSQILTSTHKISYPWENMGYLLWYNVINDNVIITYDCIIHIHKSEYQKCMFTSKTVWDTHWKPRAIMMPTFSPLVAPPLMTEQPAVPHMRANLASWQLSVFSALITHLPLDKMATISQTIFSDAFSSMKSFVFWLKFHWSLFLTVWLTITQHWSR